MRARHLAVPGQAVSGLDVGALLTYTPTISGTGSFSSPTGRYLRIGSLLYVAGSATVASTTSGSLQFTLPAGLSGVSLANAVCGQIDSPSAGSFALKGASATLIGSGSISWTSGQTATWWALCAVQ